jgi:deazaflavin-dependent oxidoreductase (nitroreductase family)
MRLRVAVACAVAGATCAVAADADRLAKLRNVSTVEISTVGRKTGRTHTVPVWFVVDGDKLWVQAGKDGKADWYLNLKKTPAVKL